MTINVDPPAPRTAMRIPLFLAAGLLSIAALVGRAAAQDAERIKVVATVPTYAALARELGGSAVDVIVLTRPGQDLHGVAATPSVMARVRDAALVLHTGLDAENWLEPMLRGSGNGQLMGDPLRFIALSDGVPLKEVPSQVSRRFGDVHAFGNTHIWTDPFIVRGMAKRVRDALVAALPHQADAIDARYTALHDRLTHALVRWLTDYAELRGRKVVTYHQSWVYFLDRFGLERVGTIEPKPRVTPTASHLEQLMETMQTRGATVVLREPYQHPDATDFVSQRTGATVLELSTHPGFPEGNGVDGVVEHFEFNLAAIATALGLPVSTPPEDTAPESAAPGDGEPLRQAEGTGSR